MFDDIFAKIYFGNTLLQYITCAVLVILGTILIFFFNRILEKKQKYIFHIFDRLTGSITEIPLHKYISPLLYIILFYTSIKSILTLPERLKHIIYIVFLASATYYGMRLLSALIKTSLTTYLRKRDKEIQEVEQKVRGISTFNNIVIWVLGIIFLISNIGFDVTAVITGLGIGGIALALASQNIFMDLFNYFVIFFDHPFQIGDFIVLDDIIGTVEKIGIKTTRIKSLQGEEIIISNTDLTSKRIHNYKKMERRRIVFSIGVVYKTLYEQLESIPALIKKIIENIEQTEFDRSHFKAYGDSSLEFETVYFILSSDYNTYMDIQQKINYNIFSEFKERGIEFAFPTRTVYLEK
ncbi:MAG: mechanosensitive ion channel family protein [Spirochaetes bacterium]|nr:mechanosensitive ion channel family protein [Spirochaetota bacterium]